MADVISMVDMRDAIRARSAGLAILSGFDLFRFMAMRSFAAYTGQVPNRATTLAALEQLKPQEKTA